jgi:ubiquinone/menaquinone biosynthesis C-methylase UbiE
MMGCMRTRPAAPTTTGEIAGRYDDFSRKYALLDRLEPLTGLAWLRRRHLATARGRVLVVAAGTGMDLRALSGADRVVATDVSRNMLAVAAGRAGRDRRDAEFAVMDAQALALRDGSFDSVVATLSLCTFPDPVAALREMARVCRPDGRVLLLDHGLSNRRWLARFQHRRDAAHSRPLGCHVVRQPDQLVPAAGMEITRMRRVIFGTFYLIDARPGSQDH